MDTVGGDRDTAEADVCLFSLAGRNVFSDFRDREREKERRNIHPRGKHPAVASPTRSVQGWNLHRGMCPDWEPSRRPLVHGTTLQSMEPELSYVLVLHELFCLPQSQSRSGSCRKVRVSEAMPLPLWWGKAWVQARVTVKSRGLRPVLLQI